MFSDFLSSSSTIAAFQHQSQCQISLCTTRLGEEDCEMEDEASPLPKQQKTAQSTVQYVDRPKKWLKAHPSHAWQVLDLDDELVHYLEQHLQFQLDRSVQLSRLSETTCEPSAEVKSYVAQRHHAQH